MQSILFAQTNTFPTTGSAGIGTTDPNASSILDMVSTTKGVLVPRMTKVQRDAIAAPAVGLLIYQTNVNPGFFYYNGSTWTAISTQDANKDLSNLQAPTAVPVTIQPNADNTVDLGSSSFSWKDFYVDGIGYLNTIKLGNFVGTPQAGMIRYTGSEFQGYNGTSWVTLVGGASTSLNNLTTTSINQSLLPDSDNARNLGSSSFGWKDVYIDGKAYITNAVLGNYVTGMQAGSLRYDGTHFEGYTGTEWLTLDNEDVIGGGGGGLNTDLSNLSPTFINQSLIANTNNYFDLGSPAFAWKNIYAENGLYIKDFPALVITDNYGGSILIGDTQNDGTIGCCNILIGEQTGKNVSDSSGANTFVGYYSGVSTTDGGGNVFLGNYSGYNNTTGSNNVFLGLGTGGQGTTGYDNVFVGGNAGDANLTGYGNVALGRGAYGGTVLLGGPTLGDDSLNVAIGDQAGLYCGGSKNIMIGHLAGGNTKENGNVFIGYYSGFNSNIGWGNVFMGENSGRNVFDGYANTFIGTNAGYQGSGATSKYNVYVGNDAGKYTIGAYNTIVGSKAGDSYAGNDQCVFMGYAADASSGTIDNAIVIGYNTQITASNTIRIGNSSMTKLGIGKNCSGSSILEFQVTTAKLTTGGVWTNASDERIKDQKTQLDKEDILAKINALKIERWHYLADAENITHIGPYAQDFYKQFQVGDDSTISTIDPAGVALIGIQALSIQQESTTDQLEMLTAENALLRQQLDNLSAIVGALQQDVSMCCASSGSTMGSSALAPALGQNIPNPFTGSTRIPYSIPSGNHTAKMLITHMGTGQIILDEEIDSSKTSMEISAGTLSSGTYSYSLIVDGRIIDTRVMVVQQ